MLRGGGGGTYAAGVNRDNVLGLLQGALGHGDDPAFLLQGAGVHGHNVLRLLQRAGVDGDNVLAQGHLGVGGNHFDLKVFG